VDGTGQADGRGTTLTAASYNKGRIVKEDPLGDGRNIMIIVNRTRSTHTIKQVTGIQKNF